MDKCGFSIVGDDARKSQSDVRENAPFRPLMQTEMNFEPEFRRCVHACERLVFNNGSRLRLGYAQRGISKTRTATSCLASGGCGLLAESRYHGRQTHTRCGCGSWLCNCRSCGNR